MAIVVVAAAGIVFVLAGTEGARYDGWMAVPPDETVYLDNADGADGAALDALAKELRKALGTAAQREEGAVAVQGDIADRVADWLKGRGAGRIVRGD